MPNLARVQQDIENDRLWKARDRLYGLFSAYPTSQEVLQLLGESLKKDGNRQSGPFGATALLWF